MNSFNYGSRRLQIPILNFAQFRNAKEWLIYSNLLRAIFVELNFAKSACLKFMKDPATIISKRISKNGSAAHNAKCSYKELKAAIIWFADVLTNFVTSASQTGTMSTTNAVAMALTASLNNCLSPKTESDNYQDVTRSSMPFSWYSSCQL